MRRVTRTSFFKIFFLNFYYFLLFKKKDKQYNNNKKKHKKKHRAIRHIDRRAKTLRMNNITISDAIVSKRSKYLWRKSNKLRYSSYLMTYTIDGNNDSTSIVDMFSNKYDSLYNFVSYDTNDIKLIERELMSSV